VQWCVRPVQLATSRTHTTILADLSADFCPTRVLSSRGCPFGMRACTRVRVLNMINCRVHVYKIPDRRIPNIGVGVPWGSSSTKFSASSCGFAPGFHNYFCNSIKVHDPLSLSLLYSYLMLQIAERYEIKMTEKLARTLITFKAKVSRTDLSNMPYRPDSYSGRPNCCSRPSVGPCNV